MITETVKTIKLAMKGYQRQHQFVDIQKALNPKRLIKSIVLSIIVCLILYTYIKASANVCEKDTVSPIEYFIYTSQCQIPFVNPFTPEIVKVFKPSEYKYTNCTNDEALITTIYQRDERRHMLIMNMTAIDRAARRVSWFPNVANVYCCYRRIKRGMEKDQPSDSLVEISPCITFYQNFSIPRYMNYIITECYLDKTRRRLLQQNAFSFIHPHRNAKLIPMVKKRRPSVILLGIDSLSRINIRRTMPKTFGYLQMNRWFELKGYNKVGYNTFPNLMALLTSYNDTMVKLKCQPKTVGGLNKPECNFIWNNFRRIGYKTAYAEDASQIGTFNLDKAGFLQPPTDYYLRPMMRAIEQNMTVQMKYGMAYCVGRKHSAEYIYDYALQLAHVYKGLPFFGLFWTNSFSHDIYSVPAEMDEKFLEYLQRMYNEGILEESIVFLLSDHGMRWGTLSRLPEGFLEQRLPMMFISLPRWFKTAHPDYVKALEINQYRLTTPYDIHETLKHLVDIAAPKSHHNQHTDHRSPPNYKMQGRSVFHEIPEGRTCNDAGITDQWCTCIPYLIVSFTDVTVKKIVHSIFAEMNRYIVEKGWKQNCNYLSIRDINEAFRRFEDNDQLTNYTIYRIAFTVNPSGAHFDGFAKYNKSTDTVDVNIRNITRTDQYEETSKCMNSTEAKKYCICRD